MRDFGIAVIMLSNYITLQYKNVEDRNVDFTVQTCDLKQTNIVRAAYADLQGT